MAIFKTVTEPVAYSKKGRTMPYDDDDDDDAEWEHAPVSVKTVMNIVAPLGRISIFTWALPSIKLNVFGGSCGKRDTPLRHRRDDIRSNNRWSMQGPREGDITAVIKGASYKSRSNNDAIFRSSRSQTKRFSRSSAPRFARCSSRCGHNCHISFRVYRSR